MVKTTNLPPEVERLWRLGFAIHWLKPNSKVPVESGWTSGERLSLETLQKTFRRAYNFGVRLGRASCVSGGYLAIVDVDVKSNSSRARDEALAKVAELFPQTKNGPYLESGRGNGSRHYYVRLHEPLRGDEVKARSEKIVKVKMPSVAPSKREATELTDKEISEGWRLRPAWEISLLSEGRQAAIVGSIHPDTGKPYVWGKAVNGSGKDIPLLETVPGLTNPVANRLKAEGDRTHLRGPERREPFELADVDVDTLPLSKDQRAALVEGRRVNDRSAKVFELCIVLAAAGVADETILSVFTQRGLYLGETAFDHAKTSNRQRAARWVEKYCLRKAKSRVHDTPFDVEEIPNDSKLKEASEKDKSTKAARRAEKQTFERIWPEGFSRQDLPWEREIVLKHLGANVAPVAKCTLANIHLILSNRAERKDYVRLEEFSQRIVWECDTPWGIPKGAERSSGNEDAVKIKAWFADEYKIEPPNTMIDEALLLTAHAHKYHVVRDYLNGLEWDNVDRLSGAFKNYLGAVMPEPYLSDVSRKFFLACVKRIFEPGCKFDHVVVLEGKQGLGKSTFASILASEKWFLDGLPNFQDKDAALNLIGSWICELGELATLARSTNETAKAYIVRQTDKVRPPYGHRRVDYPRSTVFLGTTNQNVYLTDSSGNRRYWPVKVTKCDFAAVVRDRDQLWAEAVWRYHFAPEPLYLKHESLEQARKVQELRRVEDEGDSMRILFRNWLDGEASEGRDTSEIQLMQLFQSLPWGVLPATRGNAMRGGEILKEFGYRKVHRKNGKIWVRK